MNITINITITNYNYELTNQAKNQTIEIVLSSHLYFFRLI
jgi:hypothetical protein